MWVIQLKGPEEAIVRIKEASDVLKTDTKKELQKKAWPYVRNSLRLSVLYLRLDINTCIAAKPKADKKALIIADNRIAELAGWDRDILAI